MKPATPELIERSRASYLCDLQREQHRSRGADCDCAAEHKRLALASEMAMTPLVTKALLGIGKLYMGAVLCENCLHGRAILADVRDLPPIAQLLFQMGYGL